MSDLVLKLPLTAEVRKRLESIASQMDRTVDECAQMALVEFLESWEDYLRTVADLETGEEARAVLRAAND